MSGDRQHALDTLARRAGVTEAEWDQAWATAAVVAGNAPPDPLLAQRVWSGSGHREPTDATRRARIAALRVLEHRRRYLRRRSGGRCLDRTRLTAWDAAELLAAGITHPDLVTRAAELLAAGITHPDLVTRAAEQPVAVVRAVIARPTLVWHAEQIGVINHHHGAAEVLKQCPALREHAELLAGVARDGDAAARALIACGRPSCGSGRRHERQHGTSWSIRRGDRRGSGRPSPGIRRRRAVLARMLAARHSPELVADVRQGSVVAQSAVVADPTLLEAPEIHAPTPVSFAASRTMGGRPRWWSAARRCAPIPRPHPPRGRRCEPGRVASAALAGDAGGGSTGVGAAASRRGGRRSRRRIGGCWRVCRGLGCSGTREGADEL